MRFIKRALVATGMLSVAPMTWAQSANTNAQWAVQLSGASHHFEDPEQAGRKWSEINPGLGVERTTPMSGYFDGWRQRDMGGELRDSIGKWGLYAGVVWQKRLLEGNVEVDAGAGPFVFWRALRFDDKRVLFAAPVPVLSLRHVPSGIGLNMTVVPHFKTSAGTMPSFVFAQATVNF
jgi:hypothetical protein